VHALVRDLDRHAALARHGKEEVARSPGLRKILAEVRAARVLARERGVAMTRDTAIRLFRFSQSCQLRL
jgi:hypothetical protein